MKRSAPMKRGVPLARTGFKRKQTDAFKTTFHTQTLMRKAAIKTKKKRVKVAEGSKYLAACRNEPCYLRVPGVCRFNPVDETVVPCHSNLLEHGKAKGRKADHEFTFPGCGVCHYWLDQSKVPTKEQRRDATHAALARWVPVRARKMGLEMQEAV
jgi:hypothetical protein